MYGLVESIFVIDISPCKAENGEYKKKDFQGALFLCGEGGQNKRVKYQFTEKHIHLNLSIVFFIMLLLLLHLLTF